MPRQSKELHVHPVASLFPVMSSREYLDLKEDIRAHGLMEPIWLSKDGRIIDGRHRYQACRELKIEPTYVKNKYDDDATLAAVVISLNLKRRHMNESQRAMVGARLSELYARDAEKRQKAGKHLTANLQKGSSSEKAAEALNVSTRSVDYAQVILNKAAKELIDAVESGDIAVSAGALLTKYNKEAQEKVVNKIKMGEAKNVNQALKQEKRKEQIKAIETLKPIVGEYNVIVVDPPWQYDKNREGDETQRGQTPYPTMSQDELLELDIPAANDCIVLLWVTNAHLVTGVASNLIYAWGFEPKTLLTWCKTGIGLGDWARGASEHIILAVKGKPVLRSTIPSTLFTAQIKGHSEKPDVFYEIIEKHCVGSKCEMFARKKREGWVQSGSELEG